MSKSDQSDLPGRGSHFGRYVILEQVGAGVSGAVFAAYDPRLDRRVALKLLHPCSGEPVAAVRRARLLREAQAMARLVHPNVVTVFDGGEIDGRPYISMQFVEGRTLRAWLGERPRSWREILRIFERAGRGLQAAHGAGMVHRDFKPENVLIDGRDEVRVTDFGLALPVDWLPAAAGGAAVSPGALTETGSILGTPAYMAPEQLTGGETDHRTDQFAFCVALYEALWGRRPFAGATLEALAFTVTSGKAAAPPRSEVPARVRRAVLRGLSPARAERFASMSDLLAHLAPLSPRRALARAAAGLLLAATLLGGGGWLASRVHAVRVCQAAGGLLAGTWNAAGREAVERSLLATARPHSADTSQLVLQRIDAYAGAWQAAYTEACEATRVRGDEGEKVMELRLRCLDRRRGELASLVGLLGRADPEAAERAVTAVEGLTPAAPCLHVDPSSQAADPAVQASVERLRRLLAESEAVARAGHERQALAAVQGAVAEARSLGSPGLTAEALFETGDLQRLLGEPAGAETLRLAAVEAERAGDDLLRARAQLSLAWDLVLRQGHLIEADHLAGSVGAIIDYAAPHDAELRAELERLRTILDSWLGRPAESLSHARQHLEYLTRALPAEHTRIGLAELSLGNALWYAGLRGEAEVHGQRALAMLERLLGKNHPSVGEALILAGRASMLRGDLVAALASFERAERLLEAARGPVHVNAAMAKGHAAAALVRMGRPREAIARVEGLFAVARAGSGFKLADVLGVQARLRLALDDCRGAVASARQSLDLMRPKDETQGVLMVDPLLRFADVALECGHAREALAAAREALGAMEGSNLPDDPDRATALTFVGAGLLAVGRPRAAYPLLERAWSGWPYLARTPKVRSATGFFFAQALWQTGRDRRQALAIARMVHEDLLRSDERPWRFIRRLEAWIGARTPPHTVASISAPAAAAPTH